jgi:glycerol-3-phosphate acyltransferase PlsY
VVAPYLLTALLGYLLGSIPTGYLVGRAKGLDLRTVGSGNIGATNALRVLGKPAGIFVLLMDALKGAISTTVIPRVAWQWMSATPALPTAPTSLAIVGGLAAVLGHVFTLWLRFKGGKGVATSAGVLAGLIPFAFVTVLATFLLVLALWRIVSLGSIAAAVMLPVATWYWHREPALIGFAILLTALVVLRHRANIARLLKGTEPRLGQRAVNPTPTSTNTAAP